VKPAVGWGVPASMQSRGCALDATGRGRGGPYEKAPRLKTPGLWSGDVVAWNNPGAFPFGGAGAVGNEIRHPNAGSPHESQRGTVSTRPFTPLCLRGNDSQE
jgi:hypothetical protein